MNKCFYCNKEANTCVRYIGKWLCDKHFDIFEELEFKMKREEAEKKSQKLLDAFEKKLSAGEKK